MVETAEKIFTPVSLVVLNLFIIAVVESTGEFAFETGLIHALALFFVSLAVARMFAHMYTHDPILEKFVHASLAAMAVFAFSHILEFMSLVVFHSYEDAAFANVINLYLISLILIAMGAEFFLRIYARRSKFLLRLLGAGIAVLVAFTLAFLVNDELVSLEPESSAPWVYTVALVAVAILSVVKVVRIKNLIPAARRFSQYLLVSIVFIFFAILPNIFYELLEHEFGMEEHQIIYLSHFTFFAALSVMFAAFGKLAFLGGIYRDVRELERRL